MKSLLLNWLFMLIVIGGLSAQTYGELIAEADALYEKKSYPASKEKFAQAFLIKKENASHLYNGACSASLAGDKKTALKMLTASIENGWTNIRHMKKDSDLNNLHKTRKWKKLASQLQAKVDAIEAKYNKPLQAELLVIHNEDQSIRREMMAAADKYGWGTPLVDSLGLIMQEKDEINLEKIINIIDEHGWVGPDLVGNQASSTIFLVIQHSDLEVQQKYLPVMRQAVKDGKARARSLALLEDRVALREGRKQIYGSQIGRNPDTNESYVLPLQDPDTVDERRAAVGLGTLQEYAGRFKIEWDVEEYKKRLPEYEELYFNKDD